MSDDEATPGTSKYYGTWDSCGIPPSDSSTEGLQYCLIAKRSLSHNTKLKLTAVIVKNPVVRLTAGKSKIINDYVCFQ